MVFGVLGYARGTITVFANFTAGKRTVAVQNAMVMAGDGSLLDGTVSLPPYGWVWLRTDAQGDG